MFVAAFAVSCLFAGSAFAQEASSRHEAIAKALSSYLAAQAADAADQANAEGAPTKAVPRSDKAETAVIGSVSYIGDIDFLSDGTPFRIIAVHARNPFDQDVFVVCLGDRWESTCDRLPYGRRISTTSDVLVVEDGDNAGLALFVVKKLVS
jgi:hypothetical protein